jgi:hypothetical protein
MSRGDVTALKMLKTPTANVRAAMECLGALMLAGSAATSAAPTPATPRGAPPSAAASAALKKSLHPTDDWSALQSLWVKPNFLSLLREFNERAPEVPERVAQRLAALTREESMSEQAVTKASSAAGVLWKWVLSYARMKGALAPAGTAAPVTNRPATAATKVAPRSAPSVGSETPRMSHSRRPSASRLSFSGVAPIAASPVSASKIPSAATPRAMNKSASVVEVGPSHHQRAASTVPRTAIPGVLPASSATGAATSRPTTASRLSVGAISSPPSKSELGVRRMSASSHTMAREELDSMAAIARAAGAGAGAASTSRVASALTPLKSSSSALSRPGSAVAAHRKSPSVAPSSAPAAAAASAAADGSSPAPKTPRSSIPKASDAAKYVPGGGGVKIFSARVDYSNVKSKVPGADVSAVPPPRKSDVKIVSHKIDLSNVQAKVPGHVTAPPAPAAPAAAAAAAAEPRAKVKSAH